MSSSACGLNISIGWMWMWQSVIIRFGSSSLPHVRVSTAFGEVIVGTFCQCCRDQASMPPRIDCGFLESLLPQPCGHIHRANAVMANYHDVVVRIEFLMGARGNISHGHELRAGHVRGFKLPGFAYIEQRECLAVIEFRLHFFGSDFVVHES